MQKKETFTFKGFSKRTIDFLKGLEKNNNKLWFEKHKDEYIINLLNPMRALAKDLGYFMQRIDPYLEVNKTVSRIYKDTRFSKDKSPYKTCMWITFKRLTDDWKEKPAFFFELTSKTYRYGMGFYAASKQTMDKFRTVIESDPDGFLEEVAFLRKQKTFILEGEKYKKIQNEALPKEIIEWHNRKNFYLVCNKNNADFLLGVDLLKKIVFGFDMLSSFYNYLWKIIK